MVICHLQPVSKGNLPHYMFNRPIFWLVIWLCGQIFNVIFSGHNWQVLLYTRLIGGEKGGKMPGHTASTKWVIQMDWLAWELWICVRWAYGSRKWGITNCWPINTFKNRTEKIFKCTGCRSIWCSTKTMSFSCFTFMFTICQWGDGACKMWDIWAHVPGLVLSSMMLPPSSLYHFSQLTKPTA